MDDSAIHKVVGLGSKGRMGKMCTRRQREWNVQKYKVPKRMMYEKELMVQQKGWRHRVQKITKDWIARHG